jgi:hypothetical protein
MNHNVTIADLRIRVPGISPHEGRAFGESVVRQVSESLPEQSGARELGRLHLRVSVPEGSSREAVRAAVVKAIREALG